MNIVETNNSIEAQRCRRAQYGGRAAALTLNGSTIFGMVRSVREDRSSTPPLWIVTIIPMVEKPAPVRQRFKPF